MSMGPDTRQRSMRPNDPWERMSLTPGVGFQSMAPGAIHGQNASEEDRRYTQALFLREQGRTGDAIAVLDEVCQAYPEHHEARSLQLKLALEHRDTPRIEAHAEWVVIYQAQRGQHQTVCSLYRSIRLAAQTMVWSEKALLARFDLKGFHEQILGAGALPLSVLDDRVRSWAARGKRA